MKLLFFSVLPRLLSAAADCEGPLCEATSTGSLLQAKPAHRIKVEQHMPVPSNKELSSMKIRQKEMFGNLTVELRCETVEEKKQELSKMLHSVMKGKHDEEHWNLALKIKTLRDPSLYSSEKKQCVDKMQSKMQQKLKSGSGTNWVYEGDCRNPDGYESWCGGLNWDEWCWCDWLCPYYGDCCSNFGQIDEDSGTQEIICETDQDIFNDIWYNELTCSGSCMESYISYDWLSCSCEKDCAEGNEPWNNYCCADAVAMCEDQIPVCEPLSCSDKCGGWDGATNSCGESCDCHEWCVYWGTCCDDVCDACPDMMEAGDFPYYCPQPCTGSVTEIAKSEPKTNLASWTTWKDELLGNMSVELRCETVDENKQELIQMIKSLKNGNNHQEHWQFGSKLQTMRESAADTVARKQCVDNLEKIMLKRSATDKQSDWYSDGNCASWCDQYNMDDYCWCDWICPWYGDCCSNFEDVCTEQQAKFDDIWNNKLSCAPKDVDDEDDCFSFDYYSTQDGSWNWISCNCDYNCGLGNGIGNNCCNDAKDVCYDQAIQCEEPSCEDQCGEGWLKTDCDIYYDCSSWCAPYWCGADVCEVCPDMMASSYYPFYCPGAVACIEPPTAGPTGSTDPPTTPPAGPTVTDPPTTPGPKGTESTTFSSKLSTTYAPDTVGSAASTTIGLASTGDSGICTEKDTVGECLTCCDNDESVTDVEFCNFMCEW